MPDDSPDKWTTEQVVAFLTQNGLEPISAVFQENEVTGLDLMLLTEGELKHMLGITNLQAAKVKSLVNALAPKPEPVEGEPEPMEEDGAGAPLSPSETASRAAQAAEQENDFNAQAVPRVAESAERDDHGGDAEEQEDLARAVVTRAVSHSQPRAVPQSASIVATINPYAAAATATSQPAAVLPTGTANITLDANTVGHYQRAAAAISSLESEGVAQALPAARERLKSTQQRLKLQKNKFDELVKEEEQRTQKLGNLEAGKWYPGKYLFGAKKREEKLERNKEKLESVTTKVRAAGAELEQLHVEEAASQKQVEELVGKCKSLDEARTYVAQLLENVFLGGRVGDAQENALEVEVAGLGPKLAEMRRYKTVYSQAYELMRGATRALEQGIQLLEAASRMATVDVMGSAMRGPRGQFRATPGSLMVDMVKRSQMRQGVQLCKQSGDLAVKARNMIPDMPRVQVEKLKRLQVGFGLMDVVFDNVISDMIVAAKIRRMLGEARSVLGDVAYGERWLQGWIKGRIDADLRSTEALLAARRQQLHAHRASLLGAWIEARARGAVAEAPQPAATGIPVYGAPAGAAVPLGYVV
ncbi:hypothetical protein HYH02_014184 [Chlamydomonas schloesseri]|uniref:SAM domain-containing protein n=1 Tax=Chlamydomonas schloesseri TaxID=2026947 RepID=A0A835VXG7_9CHLO|nr:hypothetical protein HYH02_014184 [Chlamydomonas schloesseri]|eukprot:KAG2429149.1 hypothetical protein HYH02_014184 [Chlamydomonas schloesseri]